MFKSSISTMIKVSLLIIMCSCADENTSQPNAHAHTQKLDKDTSSNPIPHMLTLPKSTSLRATSTRSRDSLFYPGVMRSEDHELEEVMDYEHGVKISFDYITQQKHIDDVSDVFVDIRTCAHDDDIDHELDDDIDRELDDDIDRELDDDIDRELDDELTRSSSQVKEGDECVDTIDLLVAYTPNAVEDAGGESAFLNRVSRDVALGNLALGNLLEAGLTRPSVQYRVIGLIEVPYPDLGTSSETIISQLADQNSGDSLDILHDMRDDLGADWVILYAAPGLNQAGGATCGQVRTLLTNLDNAPVPNQDGFAWVNTLWICEARIAFSHELGHLLGCTHNTSPTAGLLPSSQGYYSNGPQGIKSSLVGRPPLTNASLNRLPVYSNPLAIWESSPFGNVTAANCQGTINLSHDVVSQYRLSNVSGGVGVRPDTINSIFPTAVIGNNIDHDVVYENMGCTDVNVTNMMLTNHDPERFEIVEDSCSDQVMMPGDTCLVTIRFSATDLEIYEADLVTEMAETTASWFSHGVSAQAGWVRGDTNSDGAVDIADAIKLLDYLFGGESLLWLAAGDVNNDGLINIADAIYILMYLFQGGEPPSTPFPDPGMD